MQVRALSAQCGKMAALSAEKSGYEIMNIFEQILLYEHAKLPKLILEQKYFGIFNIFDVSKIVILLIKNIAMLKSA